MKKGSHRCDRVRCGRQATQTVLPTKTILKGIELRLCPAHFQLWKSGKWFKGLPKKW